MQKISTIALYVLAAISVILAALYFLGPRVDIGEHKNVPVNFDINLLWAAILLGLTILITFFFAIEFIITHPKSLKGAAIALVSALVLLGVSYAFASDEPIVGARGIAATATQTTLKLVDVGLISTYILGGVAIVTMLVSEVYRAFK